MVALAEKYYASKNAGSKLSNDRKMVTAQCLANVSNFINEAYAAQGTVGVQHADLGILDSSSVE